MILRHEHAKALPCALTLFFSCLFLHLVRGFLYLQVFPCCSLVSDASVSLASVVSPCARQAPCPRSSRVETARLASAVMSLSVSTVCETLPSTSAGGGFVSLGDAGNSFISSYVVKV